MMTKTACLILNRNLPEITDALCEQVRQSADYNNEVDVFVIEAGSDHRNLSKYARWHAEWPEAMQHGLRYARGMNFGLSELWKEGSFSQYDFFFLVTNDTEFEPGPTIPKLCDVAMRHPHVGILSPCSRRWGERLILQEQEIKYFWFIHNSAYFIRRGFLEALLDPQDPTWKSFVFDGNNFRGYGLEAEMIAKAYANDWAAAITTAVWSHENEEHLLSKADLIRTEPYEENLKLYLVEGRQWMKKKYGFNSRWSMQIYAKAFYDKFFEFHPEYSPFKI